MIHASLVPSLKANVNNFNIFSTNGVFREHAVYENVMKLVELYDYISI